MARTGTTAARSCRDIDGLLNEDACVVLSFELGGTVRERLVDASAGSTHELSGGGLLILRQAADFAVGKAQRRLLTRMCQPHGLEFVKGGGSGNGGNGVVYSGSNGGFIQRIRDGSARQSFSHLLFLATSRVSPASCPAAFGSTGSVSVTGLSFRAAGFRDRVKRQRAGLAGIRPAGTLPQSS